MFLVHYAVSISNKMFLSQVLYRPCSESLTLSSVTLFKFMSKQTYRILYIVPDYCARLRCSYFWLMTDTYKKLNNHKSNIKTCCSCSNCCCCACCSCCCCCRPDQRTNLFTLCFEFFVAAIAICLLQFIIMAFLQCRTFIGCLLLIMLCLFVYFVSQVHASQDFCLRVNN